MVVLSRKVLAALAAAAFIAVSAVAAITSTAGAAELVVFSSKRCPYCLAWEREIGRMYNNTQEARQAPLRRLDVQERRPGDLARLKAVHISPTFVLVDEGREVGRIVGYSGGQFFWPELHRLLAKLHSKSS